MINHGRSRTPEYDRAAGRAVQGAGPLRSRPEPAGGAAGRCGRREHVPAVRRRGGRRCGVRPPPRIAGPRHVRRGAAPARRRVRPAVAAPTTRRPPASQLSRKDAPANGEHRASGRTTYGRCPSPPPLPAAPPIRSVSPGRGRVCVPSPWRVRRAGGTVVSCRHPSAHRVPVRRAEPQREKGRTPRSVGPHGRHPSSWMRFGPRPQTRGPANPPGAARRCLSRGWAPSPSAHPCGVRPACGGPMFPPRPTRAGFVLRCGWPLWGCPPSAAAGPRVGEATQTASGWTGGGGEGPPP